MKRKVGLAVAVATLALAGNASAAKVGIGFYDGDIGFPGGYLIDYVADPGEVNQPTVTLTDPAGSGPKVVTFRDPSATFSAGAPTTDYYSDGGVWHINETPCELVDAHTARCVIPDPTWMQRKAQAAAGLGLGWGTLYATEGRIFGIYIYLGDRNDTYAPTAPTDVGETSPGVEVYGGDGNDTINAGPGPTTVFAGAGNDFINAADGFGEFISCGEGLDHVRTLDPGDDPWTDCEDVAGR